jgi:type IV secretory pathway VirB10-like protein
MKTEDILKYGAIALAVYLVWQWMTSNNAQQPVQQVGPGTHPQLPPPPPDQPASRTPAGNVPPPPVATPTPPDADLMAAALDENSQSKTGSFKLTAWEWNFYRAAAAKNAGWSEADIQTRATGDLTAAIPGGMGTKITAAEYHAALKATGLSGLGYANVWGGGSRYYV